MDILSEVLSTVRLKAAVFYNAEFSAPWGFRSPPAQKFLPYIGTGPGHIVVYHLLLEGTAWARVQSQSAVTLRGGDIVMFPHGDAHLMGSGSPASIIDEEADLAAVFSQGLDRIRLGGGGEPTRFVCGYMVAEPEMSSVLLAGLPTILRVNIGEDPSGGWLESSIRFSVDRAATLAPGSEAVLAKLSEALFVETLRRYVALLSPSETGWLAGARDPDVGRALTLLHRRTASPWTLAELAQQAGTSRSILADRFRYFLGEPPMAYLARWRMIMAARLLRSTPRGVAGIASEVGYESEAAFNRAFKRHYGVPPARFRRENAHACGPA
jgi:AraC-like DNA-binding protein